MKDIRYLKWLMWLNGGVPVALLAYDSWQGQLGANPVNFAIRTTGLLALIFLVLSLLVTPVARLTPWKWLSNTRRVFGLYACYHAAAHFLIFFIKDRALSVSSTIEEMVKRPYLVVGSIGLIVMIPLAVTSTNGMVRRLGPKRWKLLHRLAYVAAIAGAAHYCMQTKADPSKQFAVAIWTAVVTLVKSPVTQPLLFAAAVAALLLYRVVAYGVTLRSQNKKMKATPALVPTAARAEPAHKKFWSGELRVARVFDETADVKTFRLMPLMGTRLPFDHLPGQYLNLTLMIDGKKVNRSYTIASSPTINSYCEVTIKRDGEASRFMHEQVKAGDQIKVSAPAGKFTFIGTEAKRIVMIAGGVGITPLMAKIRYLTDTSWNGKIRLIYATRTSEDLIFKEELAYLAARHRGLQTTVTLSREPADSNWQGARGRVSMELVRDAAGPLGNCVIHICGPTAMADETRQLLLAMGVAAERIEEESFTSPNRAGMDNEAPASAADVARESGGGSGGAIEAVGLGRVTFARSGATAEMAADEVILEAAERVGVAIDYDCRSGICGTCKKQLLSGQVEMESEDALTGEDRANGVILCCQARCLGACVVDA